MRVVLDTNTVVSALLFSGIASRLVALWQSGKITLLVSKPILEEYLRVLAYPKFRLSEGDVKVLIEEEVLPYIKPVRLARRLRVIQQDPDDDKFLECAVYGKAKYLVTGDADLKALRSYRKVRILSPGEFLAETGLDVLT
jgi:putative PIN family toxin of toxin-antitoxin system